jgi:hypothetical protein
MKNKTKKIKRMVNKEGGKIRGISRQKKKNNRE